MFYTSISLNGAWEMQYQEQEYIGNIAPFRYSYIEEDAAGTEPEDISNNIIEDAVPGYWEDMTEKFKFTSFFHKLRINPEYGIQSYPIIGNAPDMALPNIIGTFFYHRSFNYKNNGQPTAIHFDGVQNTVSVWINDIYLGRHEGYSAPFEIQIPNNVLRSGENVLELSVANYRLKGYMGEPVTGLTSRAANECTGGITGDVEIRVYNSPLRSASVLISNDCRTAFVNLELAKPTCVLWNVCDGDDIIKSGQADGNFSFETEGMGYWSPEDPKLYTLRIKCEECEIIHKFGIRSLTAEGVKFRLNNKPYYLRGICEHCYFPETIHPNHNLTYYRNVIRKVKELGFNFIRFHTFIPEEEYMQAADELGMLLHVECPNNTTVAEWKEIVEFCKSHTSVVIYCCGNELLIDEPFIDYLRECAEYVHKNTDALFSPMNALRGIEYFWVETDIEKQTKDEPLKHHPKRLEKLGEFSDIYSSYTNGQHSYFSISGDHKKVDSWSRVYNKPRVSHEICIDGTYTDLSLQSRYKGLKVGNTNMFSSIEKHLEERGLLKNASLYFKNSSEWQRRMRKYCFEEMRKSKTMAGYDFLGPIDTHWHTFGYDVGMMNEFYELKPGETIRNVRMYNSATVILTSLGKKTNFSCGELLKCNIMTSHYGDNDLLDALLNIRVSIGEKITHRESVHINSIKNGEVSDLYEFEYKLPEVNKPVKMKLYITLDGEEVFAENEWELYLFPNVKALDSEGIFITKGEEVFQLAKMLRDGKDVLLLGNKPFVGSPTTFRIGLAGRTSGNLATVIYDHPILRDLPHEGFCGWQFANLLEGGSTICFEGANIPFNPIIEVVSTHKFVVRQASLFEYKVMGGRLLVCSFDFKEEDAAAKWLLNRFISYMQSDEFRPKIEIDETGLYELKNAKVINGIKNTNVAFNPNDKTSIRKTSKLAK